MVGFKSQDSQENLQSAWSALPQKKKEKRKWLLEMPKKVVFFICLRNGYREMGWQKNPFYWNTHWTRQRAILILYYVQCKKYKHRCTLSFWISPSYQNRHINIEKSNFYFSSASISIKFSHYRRHERLVQNTIFSIIFIISIMRDPPFPMRTKQKQNWSLSGRNPEQISAWLGVCLDLANIRKRDSK